MCVGVVKGQRVVPYKVLSFHRDAEEAAHEANLYSLLLGFGTVHRFHNRQW